jgi:hypothetical protein
MIHRTPMLALIAAIALSAEAHSQATQGMTREQADSLWLENACDPTPVDTTLWPRYRIGDVTIAMPPQYRVSRQVPYTLIFRGSYGSMRLMMHRNAKYTLDRRSASPRPKETWCDGNYGGYHNEVHAWVEAGRYNFATKWEATWGGDDEGEWLGASFGSARPEEANRLRAALNTMQPVKDDPAKQSGGNPNGWFYNPCLPDSVDTWGWTRYDLRGLRLRAPREVRQVKVPNIDELHFRVGQAHLRLRLHNDASRMFADVNVSNKAYRRCYAEISGQLAEAISFKPGQTSYGFAALWPDAERGEWLAAVIQASRLEDATMLRRVLFTIIFPDKRR